MRSPTLPPILLAGAAAAMLILGIVRPGAAGGPLTRVVQEFGIYWSSARVGLDGGDPYDAAAIWPYQHAIEPAKTGPQLTWGPPWAIGLVAPFAAVEFPAARWGWLFAGAALVAAAAAAAWRTYGGADDRLAVAWLVALTFYPTLLVLSIGQLTTFALAGVAGFAWAQKAGRPMLAGGLLGLTLAKPHNLVILWAAVGVVELAAGRWRALAGLTLSTLALSALAAGPAPRIFHQYVHVMTHRPPAEWMPPTAGTYLRLAFGGGLGVTFVPLAAGLVWLAWYLARHRGAAWDWPARLPAVLFASYLVSPYGYAYDQVMLLPAVLQAATAAGPGRVKLFLGCHLALTGLCVGLNALKVQEYTFVWLAPTLLAGWLAFTRRRGDQPETPPPGGTGSGPDLR